LLCPLLLVAMQKGETNYTEDEYRLFSIASKCTDIIINSVAIKENKNLCGVSEQPKDGLQLKNGILLDIKKDSVKVSLPLGTWQIVKAAGKMSEVNAGIGEALLREIKGKGLTLKERSSQELLKNLYPQCETPENAQAIAKALGMGQMYEVEKYKDEFLPKAELKLRNAYTPLQEIDNKVIDISQRYEAEASKIQ